MNKKKHWEHQLFDTETKGNSLQSRVKGRKTLTESVKPAFSSSLTDCLKSKRNGFSQTNNRYAVLYMVPSGKGKYKVKIDI